MSASDVKSARRPLSYAGASDREPCEGRQASPSNPTGAGRGRAKDPLTETFVFRCTAQEKAKLRAKADASNISAAMLLRETLGLVSARRRRPAPDAAPELLAALSRIGGNLNQIARWLNTAEARGDVASIDAIAVAAGLVGVERALSAALAQNARKGGRPC